MVYYLGKQSLLFSKWFCFVCSKKKLNKNTEMNYVVHRKEENLHHQKWFVMSICEQKKFVDFDNCWHAESWIVHILHTNQLVNIRLKETEHREWIYQSAANNNKKFCSLFVR